MRPAALYFFLLSIIVPIILWFGGCFEEVEQEDQGPSVSEIESIDIELDDPYGEASLQKNIMVIFDGSGSMNEDCDGTAKIRGAKNAINEFIAQVPDDVNLGLIVFDFDSRDLQGGIRVPVELGKGTKADFVAELNKVVADGGTPLRRAIEVGTDKLIEQYKSQLGYGEYRLVVVTDGIAEQVHIGAQYATQYGMSLYTISLCMEQGHPLERYSLYYQQADNYEDLKNALKATIAETETFDITTFN